MRTIVLVVDNYAPFEGIVTLCNILISNDDKLVTKAIARGAAHALCNITSVISEDGHDWSQEGTSSSTLAASPIRHAQQKQQTLGGGGGGGGKGDIGGTTGGVGNDDDGDSLVIGPCRAGLPGKDILATGPFALRSIALSARFLLSRRNAGALPAVGKGGKSATNMTASERVLGSREAGEAGEEDREKSERGEGEQRDGGHRGVEARCTTPGGFKVLFAPGSSPHLRRGTHCHTPAPTTFKRSALSLAARCEGQQATTESVACQSVLVMCIRLC